jgi:fructose-1,6-bisphosphatase
MNPKKLINTIETKCREAPERVPDYHEALLDAISDIVWAEHQHAIRATTIQKIVTDHCEALGDFIYRGTEGSKGTES